MLSNQYFYHQLTRKVVVIFGNMFNQIKMVRVNDTTGEEIERIRVPIEYGPKDKALKRIFEDPVLERPVQTILPRMSFEITGIRYAAERKQNTLLRTAKGNTATRVASQYMGVPYDLNIELNIYTKTVDDGTHIVEQILPYFDPTYTVTVNSIPELGFLRDVPITLNSIEQDINYEGGFEKPRVVTWNLKFTVQVHYYGPIQTPKIIRKVFANIYNDPSLTRGYITKINTGVGNGTFQIEDVVYQGSNYQTATAYGIVHEWNKDINKLILSATQGTFKLNNIIRGVSSNASYNIASFDATPIKLAEIKIEPDPINAEPTDDFGYTTTITEWPDTEV
jgi:T4-like virus Myoviridae tail sheath stabiliser